MDKKKSNPAGDRKAVKKRRPASGAAPRKALSKRQYLPAEERRERILEAARLVFARYGLQGARTRDLAKAAGINQATLFDHFDSKEALFAEAVLRPLAALMKSEPERYEVYESAASPQAARKLMRANTRKRLEGMVEIYPLLMQALHSDEALGKAFYREQMRPMIKARARSLSTVVKDGMDLELVQLATFGMFLAVTMDRVMLNETGKLGETPQQLINLIMFGCSKHRQEEWERASK